MFVLNDYLKWLKNPEKVESEHYERYETETKHQKN
jgi:hypothetical protein